MLLKKKDVDKIKEEVHDYLWLNRIITSVVTDNVTDLIIKRVEETLNNRGETK